MAGDAAATSDEGEMPRLDVARTIRRGRVQRLCGRFQRRDLAFIRPTGHAVANWKAGAGHQPDIACADHRHHGGSPSPAAGAATGRRSVTSSHSQMGGPRRCMARRKLSANCCDRALVPAQGRDLLDMDHDPAGADPRRRRASVSRPRRNRTDGRLILPAPAAVKPTFGPRLPDL